MSAQKPAIIGFIDKKMYFKLRSLNKEVWIECPGSNFF